MNNPNIERVTSLVTERAYLAQLIDRSKCSEHPDTIFGLPIPDECRTGMIDMMRSLFEERTLQAKLHLDELVKK